MQFISLMAKLNFQHPVFSVTWWQDKKHFWLLLCWKQFFLQD